jgi:hypothetical protein
VDVSEDIIRITEIDSGEARDKFIRCNGYIIECVERDLLAETGDFFPEEVSQFEILMIELNRLIERSVYDVSVFIYKFVHAVLLYRDCVSDFVYLYGDLNMYIFLIMFVNGKH